MQKVNNLKILEAAVEDLILDGDTCRGVALGIIFTWYLGDD